MAKISKTHHVTKKGTLKKNPTKGLPIGSTLDDEKIIELAGGLRKGKKYFERATSFGERAWIVPGKKRDIVVLGGFNGRSKILGEVK